jgi:hypothetical protein
MTLLDMDRRQERERRGKLAGEVKIGPVCAQMQPCLALLFKVTEDS